MFILVKTGIY